MPSDRRERNAGLRNWNLKIGKESALYILFLCVGKNYSSLNICLFYTKLRLIYSCMGSGAGGGGLELQKWYMLGLNPAAMGGGAAAAAMGWKGL